MRLSNAVSALNWSSAVRVDSRQGWGFPSHSHRGRTGPDRFSSPASSYVLSMCVTVNKQHPQKYRWFFFKKHSFPFRVIFPFSDIFRSWPPRKSSGQSSWLQIEKSRFDSWRYQIFWEVVGLERGPLSLVSTIEELLGRKISVFDLEKREYGHRDP
jgi:hypothetical protein